MKNKVLIILLISMTLFAAFLGLYAQNIAYYFETYLDPLKTLTVVTVTSISLFVFSFVFKIGRAHV